MNVESTLERFIVDELLLANPDKSISADESLIGSGVIDSLALVRLITFVEDQFSVTVEDDEVIPENWETLQSIVALIRQKSP